jgi:poly(A) polymerase
VRVLARAGHLALFAGGAVRDRLLGREPEDYDVATSARPEEVAGLFPRVVPVGERFGVMLVVAEEAAVEVATFRREAVYRDGRRPESVTFTADPEEDALRRDFTVNGLFEEPESGEVLDFVAGRRDLRERRVRSIGDPFARLREDRLRMLRAVRFACALDFELEAETRRAIEELAPEVVRVAGERVREELLLILTGRAPGRGLKLLRDTGMLDALLPEVAAMVGVEQPPEFHPEGDVFEHTCGVLDRLESPSPVLALAGLLHDVGKPPTFAVKERIRFDDHSRVGADMAREICRRLRVSRKETEQVAELVHQHLRFMMVRRMREAKLRRFLTGPLADEHLALHRADCLASHGDLGNWEYCRDRREEYAREPPRVEPLIRGEDLIDLGLTPGPIFAKILGEVEDRMLEGKLTSREEAVTFVRSRYLEGEDADT